MNKIKYNGKGELWITDINTARKSNKEKFDTIITVCQDSIKENIPQDTNYHHYCISDGPNNKYGGRHDYKIFKKATDQLHKHLKQNKTVLIHCHRGASRSTSISMAAIGKLLNNLRPHEAYGLIKNHRPQTAPDDKLHNHMKRYIQEN